MKIRRILFTAVFTAAVFAAAGCSGSTAARTTTTSAATAEVTTTTTAAETTEETTEAPPSDGGRVTDNYGRQANIVRTAEELAGKKVIALTFDDGPNTGVTNEILDIAEEYGIKFSFFVVGQEIDEESEAVMRRAHALGCEINSHSWTHSDMTKMTSEQIKSEMDRTAAAIYDAVSEYPKFFRPPYIAINSTLYEAIDLPFISGIGCNDWEDDVSVEKRVKFLTEKCPDGVIVLLHDQPTNEKTAEAVRQAVPVLLEQGFEFVTCSELFAAKGVTPSADREVIYSYATESGWK